MATSQIDSPLAKRGGSSLQAISKFHISHFQNEAKRKTFLAKMTSFAWE